ncbi:hypothetical protein LWC34_38770 [Kibdelosporangium philippinense]|uniref:MarR family transcriptional regulator n=1 Tax=Kibdelosporangium philippinense TaxID=211113 RepID=A0ABS8ZND8_9PSEU|nr:hypothetical protein [Kibdelosporangium philippinense]MCE7008713.1 hypothetical protein [Kibdelosporangium philippinense]
MTDTDGPDFTPTEIEAIRADIDSLVHQLIEVTGLTRDEFRQIMLTGQPGASDDV